MLWGYQRKSWVEPFERLREDFEFCYLYYQKKEFEKEVFTSSDRYYYNQFHSVQQLFKKIKPNKLVFMSIDSPITVLLNLEAKRRKIETIILQHGVFHSVKTYKELHQKQQKQQRLQPSTNSDFDARLALKFMVYSTFACTISKYGNTSF